MNEDEIWVDIQGFEGLYQVSNQGNVRSVERDNIYYVFGKQVVRHFKSKILKFSHHRDGHLRVSLHKENIPYYFQVHKLVAIHFIPNLDNCDSVHHIDHNPENNCVENLVWINHTEHNLMHKLGNGNTVYQYKNGELVGVYSSTREVERQLGFCHEQIAKCCRGEIDEAYGFKWSYTPLDAS